MQYAVYLCRKCGYMCACKEGSKTFSCVKCGCRCKISNSVRVVGGIGSSEIHTAMAKLKEAQALGSNRNGRD